MRRGEFSLHLVCEGRSAAAVEADLAMAKDIASRHQGVPIDDSIARVIRAAPFGPVDSMVGPNGERWVPTHGIVSHSDAPKVWRDMVSLFESHQAEIEKHGVKWGFLTCTMATNGFLVEPVMIWPDELYPMHRHYVRPEHLKGTSQFPPNPEARDFVTGMRQKLIEIFSRYQAVHFQIGKTYPFRQQRKSTAWSLLESLKSAVDPGGQINPGCLGLGRNNQGGS
jgi:D-lactate dehydrogenase (cytochrome)